jgi:hypothetical protein
MLLPKIFDPNVYKWWKNESMISGDPGRKIIRYTGEGDGDKRWNYVKGWKGVDPFQPRFPGKGTGGDFG